MTLQDDAMALATAPISGAEPADEAKTTFDAMAVADLPALWCALQSVGLKENRGDLGRQGTAAPRRSRSRPRQDQVQQEATGNERFRDLLRGAWCWNEPDDLKARLDAILTDA